MQKIFQDKKFRSLFFSVITFGCIEEKGRGREITTVMEVDMIIIIIMITIISQVDMAETAINIKHQIESEATTSV